MPVKQFLPQAIFLTALTLSLNACSVLAPKPKQNAANLLQQTRSSIITSHELSATSQAAILSSGFSQESCLSEFEHCLQGVQSSLLIDAPNRHLLSVLAELHYAHSLKLASQPACRSELDRLPIDEYYHNQPPSLDELEQKSQASQECTSQYRQALYQTIKHSYAYLFYDNLNNYHSASNIAQDSDIRTLDLYHLASNDLISEIYRDDLGAFAHIARTQYDIRHAPIEPYYHQKQISKITTIDDKQHTTINAFIENDDDYLKQLMRGNQQTITDLVSAYDPRLSKLDVNSRRSGIGVSMIGSVDGRYTIDKQTRQALQQNTWRQSQNPSDRIHTMGHLQITAIVKPTGRTVSEVLASDTLNIHLFNPQNHQQVEILGKSYPLSANFSAGYALWLSENKLSQASLIGMLAKSNHARLPELFMLKPFNPKQKVIIMLHGLASSPATWVNLTNTLLSDPALNEQYQVWQIAYSTNLPILENRHQIQQLIETAFANADPSGHAIASKDAVIIGHSMGGVIARLMLSDDDLTVKLGELGDKAQQDLLKKLPKDQRMAVDERLKLHALPQIGTAVFISAPFRGTDYADRWFTRAARRIIHLPLDLTQTTGAILKNLDAGSNQQNIGALYLQNGASQLSDRSSFMQLTKDIRIHPKVHYHTIVGDHQGIHGKENTVSDHISDGIVPYLSSHLDGATSETIITGRHNIHENPKTILQLRKILHAHLNKNTSHTH